ncbi:MAG TPA: type IV toxin-antitoxin system AbiEi family antitoxin domain-containing protein [Bryobacteraceae bacterium]|nr:type IV toxin-antitoxin system AbiEi family antitoxin domain-containing protein [Bryobacteraceae bacterium]
MTQPRSEAARRLLEIAEEQQGYFTAKQAKATGYAENTHPYHVQMGNWIREHRGIYRLAMFPVTEHPDLALWSLWSKNRHEEIQGVFSHQTALSLHELSDINPAKLHMTAPRKFRRNSEIPGVLVLHYADLTHNDVQAGPGFKFTRPLRTIIDVMEADEVEHGFIRQAIRQALQKGLVIRQQLRQIKPSRPMQKLVDEVLREVAR